MKKLSFAKAITLVLAFVLLVSAFGCSNVNDGDSSEATTARVTPEPTEAPPRTWNPTAANYNVQEYTSREEVTAGADFIEGSDAGAMRLDIDYTGFDYDEVKIYGWYANDYGIEKFGYSIDGTEPVYPTKTKISEGANDDAKILAEAQANIGENAIASRFKVYVPVTKGEHVIEIVAKSGEFESVIWTVVIHNTPYGNYYVRSDFDDIQTDVGAYDDLEEAKAQADKYAQTGHVVYDQEGNIVYSTYSELVTRLMREGKWVADFIRTNGFTYGNASLNPGYNWADPDNPINGNEKIVSCDRLVDWILWRAGFTDQVTANGPCVHDWIPYDANGSLVRYCESKGFIKITDVEDLQAGDICFVNPGADYGRAGHTYMCAGPSDDSGGYYRYDGGSNVRIQSVQPSNESNPNFLFAYRPVAQEGVDYIVD